MTEAMMLSEMKDSAPVTRGRAEVDVEASSGPWPDWSILVMRCAPARKPLKHVLSGLEERRGAAKTLQTPTSAQNCCELIQNEKDAIDGRHNG
jgi:hypothetical protein